MTRKLKFVVASITGLFVTLMTNVAWAQAAAPANEFERDKYFAIAAGIGIALAAFGGALGQGRTASAALSGIARNPGASGKIFTPMILGLALIESLVIYALIISFVLVGKIK
ncbi:MAG: ATP synthase F0 subunit C [Deltaproteobacteria bacterium]|nr:ATP synthase F0 subunit C [Deltaproteobacteria bacterium]